MEKLNIKQWAEEDRIGKGSAKEDAVSLMKRILADCKNNLNTLGKMSIRELCHYNGIGEAKAISILAACELGKRRQMESPEERPDLGTATRIYVDIRIIMKEAVLANATILAVCHNHPSGNLSPSSQDDHLTKDIKRASELMRIHFLDHVIITDGQYYSYHESGRC